jgi:ribosome-binding protein aMBF1 (putative translation factor)
MSLGGAQSLVCWRCGASLSALTLPLRRLEVCKACNAELHVCRMCVEFDTSYAKHCKEPTAEEVRKKDEANFCDHFRPNQNAYRPKNEPEIAKAKSALDDLFRK